MQEHLFGGQWTVEKLECVRQYLKAYMQVMKKQKFCTWYIDAFAGTGYRGKSSSAEETQLTISTDGEVEDAENFQDGSVVRALELKPAFEHYLLIEQHGGRAAALQQLRDQFPPLRQRIEIARGDCNCVLRELSQDDWTNRRAVAFLDPYGMQVEWETLQALANTKAVDLWLLFPHAYGVNRMLKRDGELPADWCARLDRFFGTREWQDVFYQRTREFDIEHGEYERIEKVANLDMIRDYFLDRMKSIFPGVADNPLTLANSKGNPLYLLCFACASPSGSSIALRIATHILKS